MEGAEWSVHETSIALSKAWNATVFSTSESASVWLHPPAAVPARPHLISVYVENRSVVHIGGADLSQWHDDDRFDILSCNFNPSICVFLSSSVEMAIGHSLPVYLMSCNIPIQAQSCQAETVHVPFNAAERSTMIMSSITRDESLASASSYVSAGDRMYFTVFHWLSGSIAATAMAPLMVDASQVKAAFSCGQFSCILAANGRIFVHNGSSSVEQSMAAIHAANSAFTSDPRCKRSNGKHEHDADSTDFAVESAWIGDQELVIHWGSGCFTAVEWFVFFTVVVCLRSNTNCAFFQLKSHCFLRKCYPLNLRSSHWHYMQDAFMRRAALLYCVLGSLCWLRHHQSLALFTYTNILLQHGRALDCSRIRRCLPARSVLTRCPGNEMVGLAPQHFMQHASSVAHAQSPPCNETV